MSKGIFWFPCFMGTEGELIFTEEIEAILVPCDEDGNSEVSVSFYTCEYNSRNGRSNTHKDSWKDQLGNLRWEIDYRLTQENFNNYAK